MTLSLFKFPVTSRHSLQFQVKLEYYNLLPVTNALRRTTLPMLHRTPPPLPGPICSMYKRKKQHHACMFLTVTYCRIIHCLQNPNVQGKPLLILHGCSVFVFITKCSFHFATNFMLGISIIMHMYNCPQCLYNIYIRTCKRVFSIELFSNT